ncbi:glycosyltransferase family 8 protein [Cucumibacter marinus]|uniref:glycosyltransferase family 8 protein n=1 Tax=Cucumibacter marinus TaxID=1121252 RepID=UPI00040AB0F4|nr:glycosyltransferase family 8 protein [Cucumibacter marinus]
MSETINVVSVIDANYIAQIEVIATSIAAHAKGDRRIVYHVLYQGPDDEAARRLAAFRRGPLEVVLHPTSNPLASIGQRGYISSAQFLKFAIADTLSDISKALFLDADVLVLKDVAELYDTQLGELSAAVVRDPPAMRRYREDEIMVVGENRFTLRTYFPEVLGLPVPDIYDAYFNAGVMLLNLDQLRHDRFSDSAVDMVRRLHDRMVWRDQDVFNTLLFGKTMLVDGRWNVLNSLFWNPAVAGDDPEMQTMVEQQRRDPWLVHFVSGLKPWRARARYSFKPVWWHFAEQTPDIRRLRRDHFWDAFVRLLPLFPPKSSAEPYEY